jgi:hypothetical protein
VLIIERLNKYIVSNDWNDINKIFDSKLLGNMPDGEPVVPWKGIEKRVKLSNFLRFSFVTFNIYYLSLILTFALATGVIVYHFIKENRDIQKKESHFKQDQLQQSNILEVDSIHRQSDTVVKAIDAEDRSISVNKTQKKSKVVNDLSKKKESKDPQTDTVTNVVVSKKVINQQVVIKRKRQLKDTTIFN